MYNFLNLLKYSEIVEMSKIPLPKQRSTRLLKKK